MPTEHYYNVFQLAERSRGTELTDLLCLQYLELPKIPRELLTAQSGEAVLKWAAYLSARSDEELAQIAMTDPTMNDAVKALERLSEDPDAQEAAYLRAIEVSDFNARLQDQRKEGVADAIRRLCSRFGIELDEARERQLREADLPALHALLDGIAVSRRWPE